jgi:hypothetical protein
VKKPSGQKSIAVYARVQTAANITVGLGRTPIFLAFSGSELKHHRPAPVVPKTRNGR